MLQGVHGKAIAEDLIRSRSTSTPGMRALRFVDHPVGISVSSNIIQCALCSDFMLDCDFCAYFVFF